MNPMQFKGVSYPSVTALARAHGILGRTLANRMAHGHTLEHSLTMDMLKGRTLGKVNTRGEWLVLLGWEVEGLCTSGKWELWGKVLRLLYRDHSTIAIASIFKVAPRVIQMDLKAFNIETRGKGGANHRTIEYRRRQQRVAINERSERRMSR